MMNHARRPEETCAICRRWFRLDARIGARQRSCSAPECGTARRRKTQSSWRARKPECAAAYRILVGTVAHVQADEERYTRTRRSSRRTSSTTTGHQLLGNRAMVEALLTRVRAYVATRSLSTGLRCANRRADYGLARMSPLSARGLSCDSRDVRRGAPPGPAHRHAAL